MKFPEVSELGHVTIEDRTFTVYLVDDMWEPDLDGHDGEHASGGCECPCYPPLRTLEEEDATR